MKKERQSRLAAKHSVLNKTKYIFFGTPQFAVIILEALIKAGYTPALVITAPDKPKGRGQKLTSPPVKILSEKYDIPVMQPPRLNDQSVRERIVAVAPDLLIVAAYGKIIPKIILDVPRKGGVNVHPSLLPRYRGPSPIQAAILNGDATTGVTVMLMDEEMDHGPILAQRIFREVQPPAGGLTSQYTTENLSEKLAELGAELLIETIPKWLNGEITPKKQDHEKATYTKIITKEDGRIDWHKSAEEIERMVRAYTPWPSAWTLMRDTKSRAKKDVRVKILKVYDNKNKNDKNAEKPGTILKQNSDLLVACGSGLLTVEKLQVEGKKSMSGAEFLNAYPSARLFSFAPSQDPRQLSQ